MRIMKYPWRKTALKRLILSFILILLPLYILAVIIYNWGIHTLQTEISRSMTSQVSHYFAELENEFSRIHTLQMDMLTDNNLNTLAAIPDSLSVIEKTEKMLNLQQRLNALRNSSDYIEEVHAYIPAIQRDISDRSVSHFDMDFYEELKNVPTTFEAQVVKIQDDMYMVAAYPYLLPGSKREPMFIVAIKISLGKLEKALHAMRTAPEEGLIYSSPQFTIATSPEAELNETILNKVLANRVTESASQSIKAGGQPYLVVDTTSDFFGAILIKYIPEKIVFEPLQKFKNWFLLFAFVSLAIIIFYSVYVYKFVHKPLSRLVRAFRKVELGDVNVQIHLDSRDEFQYIYTRFNAMIDNLRSLIDQVYKQRILAQKAEMKQLQSQINPHFLYNSFFILNTMARLGDYEQLERFTNQLGEYFQFVTRNHADEVPLSKEVHHAKIYAEIQGMRFAGRVKVTFGEMPKDIGHIMVPRLILQPLIENAFEHGLEQKKADGRLDVRIEHQDDEIRMIVDDNGELADDETIARLNERLTMSEETEMTAIVNVHQRVRLRFGGSSGLTLERNEWGGVRATITIHTE